MKLTRAVPALPHDLLASSGPSLTCYTRHHQHAIFFTATVLSQWLLLNYVSSSLMYEISADLNITPESSAHLEMNGVTDSPSLSTLEHRVGSFTTVGYRDTIFMRALSFHIWSAPKQSVRWDAKCLSSVAMFVLRQIGGNEFI